jgi:hypothetical protein
MRPAANLADRTLPVELVESGKAVGLENGR